MRMNIRQREIIGSGQFPRLLARGSHMGLHGAITSALTMSAGCINSHHRRHYIPFVLSGSSIMLLLLWFDETTVIRCACMVTLLCALSVCMVPLDSACPSHCAEPSARTVTGRRCSLYSCIEFDSDAHFSHNDLFFGASSAPQQHFRAPLLPAPVSLSAVDSLQTPKPFNPVPVPRGFAMPRLRQRMTARRGSTRGSSSGDSPSSSRLFSGIPPVCDHGLPPAFHTPVAPQRTSSPAPQSASSRHIRQTTQ